ncbi:hypothetical protein F5Y10DRAFT_285815 [Nemania abortiva]|nr:hypothetical protein F5Y10DRAFT_285815 [Nemania abortiva]
MPTPTINGSPLNPRHSYQHGRRSDRGPGDTQMSVAGPSGSHPTDTLPSNEQNMHLEAQAHHTPNLKSQSSEEDSTRSELVILIPSITPETSSSGEFTPSTLSSSSPPKQGLIRNAEPPPEGSDVPQVIERHSITAAGTSLSSSRSVGTRAISPYALPKIQMPEDMATTDRILRCIRSCINATTESYEDAHYYLKLGEPLKAVRKFQDAMPTVPPMFGEVNLFLLTRLIEIATWSSWKKFPGYEPVVFRFLAGSAAQKLGSRHPLALLLGCFAQTAVIGPSYPTTWSCVINHVDRMADDESSRAETQSIRIKAYFYLIRVLRNNGDYCTAIQRCHELIRPYIAIDGTRSFSANRARYNLGVNHCEAGNPDAVIEAYEEARKYRGTVTELNPREGCTGPSLVYIN